MIVAAIALTALPFVMLRRSTLWTYVALDIATCLFSALVWLQIGDRIDPYLAAVVLGVAKVCMFSLFVANGEHVRWSPSRAALSALIIYALLIPAMQRTPIDGDEPYYLLVTESIVRDGDRNLANQYATLAQSQTGRTDLQPQLGDRVGSKGQQYSRLEPFLSVLLIPGYLVAGRAGAIATIILFAALLLRSTLRWFEDEGIDENDARAVFPFLAFGPPIVFFAARLWPEVPAAFLFVEALRGVRARRTRKWVAAAVLLCALKLRFVLVAVALLLRRPLIIAVLIGLSILFGAATGMFGVGVSPVKYATGFLGLFLDGAAGIAFQAPFYLLIVVALVRWHFTPEGFRLGIVSSLLYLALLIPRSEWHGGWSPPLRYIAFLTPVAALGIASIWSRIGTPFIALISVWSAGLVVHGVAYPFHLFHIANGENVAGEALSRVWHSDFSRMFPSFIRLNDAAIGGIGFLALLCGTAALSALGRRVAPLTFAVVAIFIAWFFYQGQKAGRVVHFEDTHVAKQGGELYPPEFTVARFNFVGGWMLHGGNAVTFLARGGEKTIFYSSREPSTIQVGSRTYELPPTADAYRPIAVVVDGGRVELRCLRGSVNLDRIE